MEKHKTLHTVRPQGIDRIRVMARWNGLFFFIFPILVVFEKVMEKYFIKETLPEIIDRLKYVNVRRGSELGRRAKGLYPLSSDVLLFVK